MEAYVETVTRLRDEVAELRERVRLLEAALVGEWLPPREWHLTRSEAQIFWLLARREFISREQLVTALYAARPDKDQPVAKIVDVHICKMRRKLDPLGAHIETVYGRGYALRDRQFWLARAA